jgi:hypothetical protein
VGVALALGEAGLGAAQSVASIIGGARQKKRRLGAVETGYNIARENLAQNQALGRESGIESLNARGILTGGPGQGFAKPANIANVNTPATRTLAGVKVANPSYNPATDYLQNPDAGWQQKYTQEYYNAIQGSAGAANTVAGQEQADLSKSYYNQQRDLEAQRQNARQDISSSANAQILGGVMQGAGSVLSGVLGATAPGPGAIPTAPSFPTGFDAQMPFSIPSAASPYSSPVGDKFGIDAVNPLGSPSSVRNFNVLKSVRSPSALTGF